MVEAAPYNPMTHPVIRILSVRPGAGYVLTVRFDDGVERTVSLSETIERNQWFAPLRLSTAFEDVEIIYDGRALEWASGVDYCADALRIKADEQDRARRDPAKQEA